MDHHGQERGHPRGLPSRAGSPRRRPRVGGARPERPVAARLQPGQSATFTAIVTKLGSAHRCRSPPTAPPSDLGAPGLGPKRGPGVRRGPRAARRRICFDRYERVERIDFKSAKDVVTEVDHLSEALIIEAIRARSRATASWPRRAASTTPRRARAELGRRRAWVIDPLDGTINYANGIPFFCVSIALVVDGRPVVGVVHDPSAARRSRRRADGPATLDGRPIAASVKDELSDFVVSMALVRPGGRRAARGRSQGDPRVALDGLRRARAGLRRQRPVRRLRPAGRAVGLGRRRGRASSPSVPARRSPTSTGGPGSTSPARPARSASLAAPAAHHARAARAWRG